jgi:hypothetical protein
MENDAAAASLVNDFFTAVVGNFTPVKAIHFAEASIPLAGRPTVLIDHCARTEDRRQFIVEMHGQLGNRLEAQVEQKALFCAASILVQQSFALDEPGFCPYPSRHEWFEFIKPLYFIQFFNEDPRETTHEAGFVRFSFCRRPGLFVHRSANIFVIRIILPLVGFSFGVVDSNWEPLDWWCYLFLFAHLFTSEQIADYKARRMPVQCEMALARLDRAGRLSAKMSGAPVSAQSKPNEEAESDPHFHAELLVHLTFLIQAFVRQGVMDSANLEFLTERVSASLIRSTWSRHLRSTSEETRNSCEELITILRTNGKISEVPDF